MTNSSQADEYKWKQLFWEHLAIFHVVGLMITIPIQHARERNDTKKVWMQCGGASLSPFKSISAQ